MPAAYANIRLVREDDDMLSVAESMCVRARRGLSPRELRTAPRHGCVFGARRNAHGINGPSAFHPLRGIGERQPLQQWEIRRIVELTQLVNDVETIIEIRVPGVSHNRLVKSCAICRGCQTASQCDPNGAKAE